jgi:hypothetical protein
VSGILEGQTVLHCMVSKIPCFLFVEYYLHFERVKVNPMSMLLL